MPKQRVYRVIFVNQGQVYELYAGEVSQPSMVGFVEVGGLRFGEKSSLLVDPSEERLKSEFAGVERFYVPLHAVIRIDELSGQEGGGKITALPAGSNVTPFPAGFMPPKG